MTPELVERVARAIHTHLSRRNIMQYLDNEEDCEGIATAALEASGIVQAREALEAFAKAAGVRLCAGEGYWTDDKSVQGTDVSFHITFGDLRRARQALSALDGRG